MMQIFKLITDDSNGIQCSLFLSESELRGAAFVWANERAKEPFPEETTLEELRRFLDDGGFFEDRLLWSSESLQVGSELEAQLGRCHEALEKCIVGLDMDDQFGDDIDARHAAEEDAFHSAKNALPSADPDKCYAVSGRFQFDDEDTVKVFWASSQGDAVSFWESAMKADEPENKNELVVVSVVESYAQIEVI